MKYECSRKAIKHVRVWKKQKQKEWAVSARDGFQRLPFVTGKTKHHKKRQLEESERLTYWFRKTFEINVAYLKQDNLDSLVNRRNA